MFSYSDEFKRRDDLLPIAAFSDKEKVYESRTLWPFFLARMPPMDRPDVERLVSERKIDPEDTFLLLAELGKRTITSPYEFESFAHA